MVLARKGLLRISSTRLEKASWLGLKKKKAKLEKDSTLYCALLAPMLLADRPCFQLLEFLTKDLAVGRAMSTGGQVAISFSRCFLQNVLSNFQRHFTAKVDSQIFFSSRQSFNVIKQQRSDRWLLSDFLAQISLLQISSTLYSFLLPILGRSGMLSRLLTHFLCSFFLAMTRRKRCELSTFLVVLICRITFLLDVKF